MNSAKEAIQTSIKIFPVSSGTKHRQVEVEHQDEIDFQIHPTTKPEADPENMVANTKKVISIKHKDSANVFYPFTNEGAIGLFFIA